MAGTGLLIDIVEDAPGADCLFLRLLQGQLPLLDRSRFVSAIFDPSFGAQQLVGNDRLDTFVVPELVLERV